MPRKHPIDTIIRALPSGRVPPPTPRALHDLIKALLDVEIATAPLLDGSAAPFDYLVHSFFEGTLMRYGNSGRQDWRRPPSPHPADCVVWAARGAGKTFLGAIATTFDLLFKPGIEIRLLAGSLEQAQRMHEHLRRFFERPILAQLLAERITERSVLLRNGSRARLLAQSQTSVRGSRVQKLRCDEVELFDPEVWSAAQLTTRSMRLAGPWGDRVRGSIEALSTMHRPYGLMWKLVTDSGSDPDAPEREETRRRIVFRWGLIDVLSNCGPDHACDSCDLHPECAGRAKERDTHPSRRPGHVTIDDAVRMKSRVSHAVWESEMLCLRPRRSDCVFPEFDPRVHVGDWALDPEPGPTPHPDAERRPAFDLAPERDDARRRWVAGMDFGIRAPTVILLAWYRPGDPTLYVEAEHVQSDWTIDQHADVLLRGVGGPAWPSPAPAIEWVGVDPAGTQRSEQTGASCVSALRKRAIPVRWRRIGLHDGIELLRARLRPAANGATHDAGNGQAGGAPRLFIHRRCAHLIESLTRYHYPEDRPESLEPVKDGADHAVDALRYLVTCLDKPHSARVSKY